MIRRFLLCLLLVSGVRAAEKPDLVIFLTDDHSWLDTSIHGSAEMPTPNMARVAAAGMSFDNAFVASPSCAPSRASLLTGLMPVRHGAEANHEAPGKRIKKLPAYLKELGYEVVAFGKVGHYKQTKDYGFDHFAHTGYHDDVAIDVGIRWLKERKSDQPLCLFIGTNWPHVPWPEKADAGAPPVEIPPTHVDTPETRAARARYQAAVRKMDDDMGKVFDAAYEVLGEDTFFLTTADHGAQWPFAKWDLYDAGTRVPFLVVWPDVVKPGTRTDAMASWVDILPTLVEVAGGAPPAKIDGRSIVPVLRGETDTHREKIFTTHTGDGTNNVFPSRALRTDRWKLILNLHPEFHFTTHVSLGTSKDGWSYYESWRTKAESDPTAAATVGRYHRRPGLELYDLESDPNELKNLAEDPAHADRVGSMRAEIEQWMRANGDKGRIAGEPRLHDDPDRDLPRPAEKR